MVREMEVRVDNQIHTVVISDEQEALLAAQADGRAVIGVEPGMGAARIEAARYIIPGWEFVNVELAELVLRRHLGLPWNIARTERLTIRELTAGDIDQIPGAELGEEEALFGDPQKLPAYIESQYGFYEYGTWALLGRGHGRMVGLAGVSQLRLPPFLEQRLNAFIAKNCPGQPFLELGYHIFHPYRRRGYALEACREISDYARQVLCCRVCAVIAQENKASRRVAESLGMKPLSQSGEFMETGSGSSEPLLLYAETR
ncbi:MAG: GNAT family N-acetyltransferase [Clostridium sp.]|nr:GNAT family N-acetyltransferase [Clostridium sp.]